MRLAVLKCLAPALLLAAGLAGCGDAPEPVNKPEMATLNGSVTYRERMMLRPDATITVRLQDVSRQDAPALLIAEQQISALGKSVPVPFSIEYDPARIDERYTYAVRAEIRGGDGALLWTTDTHHPVLTRGAPQDGVDIMVVAVGRQ